MCSDKNDSTSSGLYSFAEALGLGATSTQPSSSSLVKYFSKPEVHGLYYRNQQIHIDGYKFVGCRFDQCTLIVNTTNFELINCVLDPSTAILYGSNLIKVIKLFNSRIEWAYTAYPGFVPRKNYDGTITISEHTT